MEDKTKELREYVDERFSQIDEAVRLLFLNSIAREIEAEVTKGGTGKRNNRSETKSSELELNAVVICKPEEETLTHILKPLGVKLKRIECLQKKQFAMLTCKNSWKIVDVRKVSALFAERFSDITPVFCASEMPVATKRVMIKENYNFIVKNKEFRIFAGR